MSINKLILFLYFISVSGFANLDLQIPLVKNHVKNYSIVRLILGVGNTAELSQNPGPNPFLANSQDILANNKHEEGVLPERSLTFNFNDLESLQKLAENFPDTFDVITADYFVTKYADWTSEHVLCFYKMLKANGLLAFPIDDQFDKTYRKETQTKEELFSNAHKALFSERKFLYLSPAVSFNKLPQEIAKNITWSNDEVVRQMELYKKIVKDFDISTRPKSQNTQQKMKDIGLSPPNYFLFLTKEILQNDTKLRLFVERELREAPKREQLRELEAEFLDKYVIPFNLRLAGQVFDPQKIAIKQNVSLPQPHRDPVFSGLVFSATK